MPVPYAPSVADPRAPRRPQLSLRVRVRLVLAAITIPSLVALGVALATEPATDAARREVSERLDPARVSVEELHAAMVDQETGLRGYLLSGDPSFLEPFASGRARASEIVEDLESSMTTTATRARLDAVIASRDAWEDMADAGVAGRVADADSLQTRKAAFDAFRRSLSAFDRAVTAEVEAAEHEYDTRRRQQRRLLAGTIGAASLLSLLGAFLLTRWLRGPLDRLAAELAAAASDPTAGVAVQGPVELAAIATRADTLRRTVLEESRDRLRRGLVIAQEEERRRIAAGLHDEVIQSLTAVGLRLQALRTSVAPGDVDLLEGASEAVGDGIDRLRSLLFELHPPALDRHGLAAAIESFAQGLLAGTSTALRVTGNAGSASVTVQSLAYRAAREAITNAWKHAGATTITVDVQAGAGDDAGRWLRVVVADDGEGFEPAAVRSSVRAGHLGLLAAEELVVGSMGQWKLASNPGSGTVIEIWLPDPEGD